MGSEGEAVGADSPSFGERKAACVSQSGIEPNEKAPNGARDASECGTPHVRTTIRLVEHELRELMRQRAGIAKRIGSIKKTISGLSLLFGDKLPEDLRECAQLESRRWGRKRDAERPPQTNPVADSTGAIEKAIVLPSRVES